MSTDRFQIALPDDTAPAEAHLRVRILLVDDEPRNLDVLEGILDAPDYEFVRARTPDEALMALLRDEFAAIVLDINLPGMSGLELAQLIKQRRRTRHVPIIFLTAYYYEDRHVVEGYSAGAVDYLTKPFNPQVLRSKVAVFVDLFRKTRALAEANDALQIEVNQRKSAEEALQRINEELESRVERRTADLKRAHQNLSESERQYRELVHALPVAAYTTDLEGRILIFNAAAVDLWGREPRPDDRWCAVDRIYHPDGSPLAHNRSPAPVAVHAGRSTGSEELVLERPDGSRRHVLAHPKPLRNRSGAIVGAINVLVDITERKEQEDELQRREQIFRAIGKSINYGIWVCNAEGQNIYTSEAFLELVGMTQEECSEYGWARALPDGEAEEAIAEWMACVSLGAPWEREYMYRGADGSFHPILTRGVPIRDRQGQITRWVGINLDIHDFKVARDSLRRRTRTLELLNEMGAALVAELDADRLAQQVVDIGREICSATFGIFLFRDANTEADAPLKRRLAGAAGHDFSPASCADLAAWFGWTGRDGRVTRIEDGSGIESGQAVRFPGVERFGPPMRCYLGVPVVSRSGELIGGLIFGHSETGAFAPESEDALAATAAQAAMAIDNANLYSALQRDLERQRRSEAAVAAHARRAELLSDATAKLLMADSPDDLLDEIFTRFAREVRADIYLHHTLPPDDNTLHLARVEGIDKDGLAGIAERETGTGPVGEVALRRTSLVLADIDRDRSADTAALRNLGIRSLVCHPLQAGSQFFGTLTLASTSREQFTSGEVRFLETLCDVVAASLERNRLLREVSHARDVAEHASRAKDDFLAALSHELRTPLNPVMLIASEAANNPALPLEAREDFATISEHAGIEARLIDDLLDLTRIARGKLLLKKIRLDLHELLNDSIGTLAPGIEEKRICLDVHLDAARAEVVADPTRLRQVFWNLLKNSVKFTPEGGTMSVRTGNSDDERSVTVSITDSGIGMTPAELETVFDAFAQGEHARSEETPPYGGLGLGLAISRTLVEMHRGVVTAASSGRGKGATFTIELPLARRNAPITSGPKARGSSPAEGVRPTPRTIGANSSPRRILVLDDHAPTRTTLSHLLRRRGHLVSAAESLAAARKLCDQSPFDLLVSDLGLPDGDGCTLMKELRSRQPRLVGVAISGYGMDDDIARSHDAGFIRHLTKPINIAAIDRLLDEIWATSADDVELTSPLTRSREAGKNNTPATRTQTLP